jgi:metalloendopeptidase OMA1, mitochondrial
MLYLRRVPVRPKAIPHSFTASHTTKLSRVLLRPRTPFRPFTKSTSLRWQEPSYNPQRHQSARPLLSTNQIYRVARSRNTHGVIVVAILAAFAFYFSNIQTVPVSGRRRFNCYSEKTVEQFSDAQVKRIEYEVQAQGARFLPDWDPRTILVRRVMRRLIPVSGLQDQNWDVRVIEDPGTANAFVLPGGKVFVHSGILKITRTESGLAAVLGHEIAHNLAQHMAERMSAAVGTNILLGSLLALSAALPGGLLLTQFFGGAALDLLFGRPMNRKQESEADYIGLMLMAEACYDPREAIAFWQRMEKAAQTAQGVEIPEFISTHPSVSLSREGRAVC